MADNDKNDLLDINEPQIMAAFCYIGVLVLVPLFLRKKDDPFVLFHLKQGMIMLAALVLALILSSWIKPLGNFFFVIVIIADIMAFIQALLGRWWKIPLVGNLADKFRI